MTTTPTESSAESLRIAIVDDHAILRQGLRSVLEREEGLSVVAEAASADEALVMVAEQQPHVVLLDLKLSTSKDREGLEVCAMLSERNPDVAVLVLTTFLDEQLVLRAVRAGAAGYVVKDVDTSGLVRAIQDVSRGGSAFDPRSAAAMVRGLNAPPPEPPTKLTARELEVLGLLAAGMSNRMIGERLFVSETTAKFHVGNILRKLGVSRRAEAVYEASKAGLL